MDPPTPLTSTASGSSPTGGRIHYYDKKEMKTSDAILARLATRSSLTPDSSKLILSMVGLPARGKSFISHRLAGFLNWSGCPTEIFNAGQRRRHDAATAESCDNCRHNADANFFSPSNEQAKATREQIAMSTVDELLSWFQGGGEVGILDATNSTRSRRAALVARAREFSESTGDTVSVVFIESLCDESDVLEANMLTKISASPDFAGLTESDAVADLKERISNYERVYETVADDEGAYIKLFNLSSKVCANHVFGRMSTRVLPYLTTLHIRERPVYLLALPPGHASEATHGPAFAQRLVTTVSDGEDGMRIRVVSSTQPVPLASAAALASIAKQGSAWLPPTITHQPGLNPLDRGTTVAEGPELLSRMAFNERFAGGGESFSDLVRRLEPCLFEIEASMDPVLVLAHGSPCRALRAYFLGLDVASCMGPASTPGAEALANEGRKLVKLTPMVAGGWLETIIDL